MTRQELQHRTGATTTARARSRLLARAARRLLANAAELARGHYMIPPGYLRALETATTDAEEAFHKEDETP